MRTRTQNGITGNTYEANYHRGQQERSQNELQFFDSGTVKVEQTLRGVRFHAKVPPFISGGDFQWQTPKKELDPTQQVAKNTFVYISPLNTIVTTGLTDLTLLTTVKATPGIWQAIQDVPAATVDGYNVPQYLPAGAVAPSGDPLSGDLDGDTIFWVLWSSPAGVCPLG